MYVGPPRSDDVRSRQSRGVAVPGIDGGGNPVEPRALITKRRAVRATIFDTSGGRSALADDGV